MLRNPPPADTSEGSTERQEDDLDLEGGPGEEDEGIKIPPRKTMRGGGGKNESHSREIKRETELRNPPPVDTLEGPQERKRKMMTNEMKKREKWKREKEAKLKCSVEEEEVEGDDEDPQGGLPEKEGTLCLKCVMTPCVCLLVKLETRMNMLMEIDTILAKIGNGEQSVHYPLPAHHRSVDGGHAARVEEQEHGEKTGLKEDLEEERSVHYPLPVPSRSVDGGHSAHECEKEEEESRKEREAEEKKSPTKELEGELNVHYPLPVPSRSVDGGHSAPEHEEVEDKSREERKAEAETRGLKDQIKKTAGELRDPPAQPQPNIPIPTFPNYPGTVTPPIPYSQV